MLSCGGESVGVPPVLHVQPALRMLLVAGTPVWKRLGVEAAGQRVAGSSTWRCKIQHGALNPKP